MTVNVILTDLSSGIKDEVAVENIENKRCFEYIDNQGNLCEICTYDDGICLFEKCPDHQLELHLKDDYYAKITTAEGEIKLDAKVVDFIVNDDILVVRYIIDENEREIAIIYRS